MLSTESSPPNAEAILHAIDQLDEVGERSAEPLARAVHAMGADVALFISFIREDATRQSYRYVVACDPAWATRYARCCFDNEDPCVRYALYNTEMVLADQLPLLNDRERAMIASARDVGFVSALVVPAPTAAAQSRVGVLCIGSRQPGYFDDPGNTPLRHLARSLAMQLSDQVQRLLRDQLASRLRLTPMEIQLLRYEQLGYSSKEMSKLLDMPARTIDVQFSRLHHKIGVANRRDAVRFAELYNLI